MCVPHATTDFYFEWNFHYSTEWNDKTIFNHSFHTLNTILLCLHCKQSSIRPTSLPYMTSTCTAIATRRTLDYVTIATIASQTMQSWSPFSFLDFWEDQLPWQPMWCWILWSPHHGNQGCRMGIDYPLTGERSHTMHCHIWNICTSKALWEQGFKLS